MISRKVFLFGFLEMSYRENFEPSSSRFGERSNNYIGVLWLETSLEIEDTLQSFVVVPTSLVLEELRATE